MQSNGKKLIRESANISSARVKEEENGVFKYRGNHFNNDDFNGWIANLYLVKMYSQHKINTCVMNTWNPNADLMCMQQWKDTII